MVTVQTWIDEKTSEIKFLIGTHKSKQNRIVYSKKGGDTLSLGGLKIYVPCCFDKHFLIELIPLRVQHRRLKRIGDEMDIYGNVPEHTGEVTQKDFA